MSPLHTSVLNDRNPHRNTNTAENYCAGKALGHDPAVGVQSHWLGFNCEVGGGLLAYCDSGNGSPLLSCRTKLPSICSSVTLCPVAVLSKGGCNAGINKIQHALRLYIPGAIMETLMS